MSEDTRLNKYLAECGVCSRREADKLIASGRVSINGRPAELGERITSGDTVYLDGKPLSLVEKKTVLAFYKPEGVVVSESDPHAEKTVFDLIDYPQRLTYAGRLDKDSEGLLLLTNDGDLIHAMMQGSAAHEKEYIVKLNRDPEEEALERLRGGIWIKELECSTKPCRIESLGRGKVRMVLKEGLNRQIRRMWSAEHYHVRNLKRVRVVTVRLGELKAGEYRELEEEELKRLYKAVGLRYEDR
ncbi:MAG: rRNA pseudouridine synthase [Lachnospiraceae bacterium]|nr:rRNA pseudouridine synthase [Lachnospiraceae bacterium]